MFNLDWPPCGDELNILASEPFHNRLELWHMWKGKPAPPASASRAPWSLSPNLQKTLKNFLPQWHLQVLAHQVPCHVRSFKTIFVKHPSLLDQLCNHKQVVTTWSTTAQAECRCKNWSGYKTAVLNPSDPHWVPSGSLLTFYHLSSL